MRKQSTGKRGLMDDIRRIATAIQGIPRLLLNQGAADTNILEFKSPDVAHGITGEADTDTFGFTRKSEGGSGGLRMEGLKDADGVAGFALWLIGVLGEAADTTKTTAGNGVIVLQGAVKSGTNAAAVGADGNVVVIRNHGTTRFIFDAEGSAHADVEWIAFENHDDVALLDTLEETLLADQSVIPGAFGEWIEQNKADLEGLDIAHFDETPGHAMINWTRLAMLQVGALRQMGERIEQLEHALLEAGNG